MPLARMLTCAVILGSFASLASANHLQTDSGRSISFDHKTGNEHWVEVVLGGAGAATVQRVDAQEEFERRWIALEKKSWGAWAASFHIPQGEEVRFRVAWSDGTSAVSCWFAHPSGNELCDNAPPPAGWRAANILTTGETPGDLGLAMADTNGNGRMEVFTPTRNGLFVHEHDGAGTWSSREILPMFGDAVRSHVVVGDIDGDGRQEGFSSGWGGQGRDLIYVHEWDGVSWQSNLVAQLPFNVRSMVFGDVDDDGDDEVYIGTTNGFRQRAIYRMDRPAGGSLALDVISTGASGLLSIGDADRDGDDDLWSAGYDGDRHGIWRVDLVEASWMTHAIAVYPLSDGTQDIFAGDADNDGQEEFYVLVDSFTTPNRIDRFSFRGGDWVQQSIPIGPRRAFDLVRGDLDHDGRVELYAGDTDGRILQARWSGIVWVVTTVAQAGTGDVLFAMTSGDAGGDGRLELYAAGSSHTGICCARLNLHRVTFTPTQPAAFDATFAGVRGNEWWVQANVVSSGGTLAGVDVSLNGGAWKPLAKQSWGGWAASYRIVQGTVVQLRATSTAGATDLGDCYQWIPPAHQDAAKVSCASRPQAFDASFSNVQGNEWWVQAHVLANEPLAGVDARVDCGSWVPLTLQSWGGWAKSFHVPGGSKVDFRARATSGATDVSGGYVWPQATPTNGC